MCVQYAEKSMHQNGYMYKNSILDRCVCMCCMWQVACKASPEVPIIHSFVGLSWMFFLFILWTRFDRFLYTWIWIKLWGCRVWLALHEKVTGTRVYSREQHVRDISVMWLHPHKLSSLYKRSGTAVIKYNVYHTVRRPGRHFTKQANNIIQVYLSVTLAYIDLGIKHSPIQA